MTTNFFNNIADLNVPGNWKFSINTDDSGQFTVSALFSAVQNGDHASKIIPPMVLRGTAIELDEGFFEKIAQPVQDASGLFHNMNEYLKGLEEAKKLSKMEQDKKTQDAKAKAAAKAVEPKDGIEINTEPKVNKEEKRKAYDDAMSRIADLNDACKYAEALAILPSAEDHPEKKAEVEKKKTDLERKQQQYEQALQLFNKE